MHKLLFARKTSAERSLLLELGRFLVFFNSGVGESHARMSALRPIRIPQSGLRALDSWLLAHQGNSNPASTESALSLRHILGVSIGDTDEESGK